MLGGCASCHGSAAGTSAAALTLLAVPVPALTLAGLQETHGKSYEVVYFTGVDGFSVGHAVHLVMLFRAKSGGMMLTPLVIRAAGLWALHGPATGVARGLLCRAACAFC